MEIAGALLATAKDGGSAENFRHAPKGFRGAGAQQAAPLQSYYLSMKPDTARSYSVESAGVLWSAFSNTITFGFCLK